jgi:hypothetical protein
LRRMSALFEIGRQREEKGMGGPMHLGKHAPLRSALLAAAILALASGCTEEDWLAGESKVSECLSPQEIRKRCNEEFNTCLNSPIQNIPSGTSGHSLCWPCKDVCMQSNGVWPVALWDGRPCR